MIDPLVRPARVEDAALLRELEADARAALVDARGGRRWLEEHPLVGDGWAVATSMRTVVVADLVAPGSDPLVVGYIVLDQVGELAVVDQVYVRPEARELGFGDALLAAARDVARAGGAAVFEGQSLPGDRNTKNLYERAGITARLITVSTRLD